MFTSRQIDLAIDQKCERVDGFPVYTEKNDRTRIYLKTNFVDFTTMVIHLHALKKTGEGQRDERRIATIHQTHYGRYKKDFREAFVLTPCPLKSSKHKDVLVFTVEVTLDDGSIETYMSQYFYMFSKGTTSIPFPNLHFKDSMLYHNSLTGKYMKREDPWWRLPTPSRGTKNSGTQMISTIVLPPFYFAPIQVPLLNQVTQPVQIVMNELNLFAEHLMNKETKKKGIQKSRKMKNEMHERVFQMPSYQKPKKASQKSRKMNEIDGMKEEERLIYDLLQDVDFIDVEAKGEELEFSEWKLDKVQSDGEESKQESAIDFDLLGVDDSYSALPLDLHLLFQDGTNHKVECDLSLFE